MLILEGRVRDLLNSNLSYRHKMNYSYINNVQQAEACPPVMQRWMPTTQNPYPMNFVQAPSPTHQVLVQYNGQSYLQGLSINKGPVMYPTREVNCNPVNAWEHKHTTRPKCCPAVVYPTTHSIPGPYLQSYIALPRRQYPY